jgi:hypothetical protein
MASRQEEKQRRREERLAREQAEASAAARHGRLKAVFGGLGVIAATAAAIAVGVLVMGAGNEDEGAEPTTPAAAVELPQQQTADYKAAAKAAGCELQSPTLLAATHDSKDFQASDYNTNPPTSGPHNPDWYEDGIYRAGDTPRLGMLVHALEHGRINVQYALGTSERDVARLEAFLAEQSDGYHMLLFGNATNMKYAVAATGWGQLLGCETINDKTFDALRTFRERYIDKGPESVP